MVKSNLIKNCPITINNIHIAEDVSGLDMATLNRKTVSKTPNKVKTNIIQIPKHAYERNRTLTILYNIMFLNKLSFLIILIRGLTFMIV